VADVVAAFPRAQVIYSIIQKDNHCRFMLQTRDGKIANPGPGSYFEDARITPPSGVDEDFADFYLIPTFNATSTAKPIHYCIIKGSTVMPLNQFQYLTFVMCHLYPNWASSIRVPFVTQAAHKLAFLLGDLPDPEIHKKLASSFFYL